MALMNEDLRGVCGTVMHTPIRGEVEIIEDTLITYAQNGIIQDMLVPGSEQYGDKLEKLSSAGKLTRLNAGQYLLPGLIDLHVHAPQWPQLGKVLHLPLYEWLDQYTFPLEARYADTAFAHQVYESLVSALLAQGTTTVVYFGTIHVAATSSLARICHEQGQRAFVGRVAMDDKEQCPDYYRDEDAAAAMDATVDLIESVNALSCDPESRLVHPVVTPRFIPSCTDELLIGLGDIAQRYGCHVQSHCSESDWEHGYVLNRFGKTDAQSHDDFGLLTDRTILAHCNFITDNDMRLFVDRGSSVAHCPLSNFYFANAVFPLRRALSAGVKVGLGTDISGGPSASILDNCCQAVVASRALEDGVNPSRESSDRGVSDSRINFMESFWLATTGGAQALGIPAGWFCPGNYFDAIMIDTESPGSSVHTWVDCDGLEDVFQKIVYHARQPSIRKVWVGGKLVTGH
jgi:guanine deaminase